MNRNLKENHDFAKHQQEAADKKENIKLIKQSAVEMNSPKLEYTSSEAWNNKILKFSPSFQIHLSVVHASILP